MARNKTTRYHKHLVTSLREPQEAFEYLKAALEEDDTPEVFLLALRHVAEARGIAHFARQARLNRENLYRILSREGNIVLVAISVVEGSPYFTLSATKRSKDGCLGQSLRRMRAGISCTGIFPRQPNIRTSAPFC